MWFGFALMFLTGMLLFYAIPVRTSQSLWFRIKLLLLVVAALNAWLFHRELGNNSAEPFSARLKSGALASLVLWAGIVISGRFIAYDWFDCVQQPGALIQTLAGCVDGQEIF